MKNHKPSLLTIGIACLFAGALATHAQVLLDDTFADGSRTESNLPTESAVWAGTPGSVTMSSGSLLYAQGTGSQKLWTYFTPNVTPNAPPVSLGVGERLLATIQFAPKAMLYDNSSRSFRFGLFHDPTDPQVWEDINSDGGGSGSPWTDSTGYGVQIALSTGATASTDANVGKRTDQSNSSLMGSSGAWTFSHGGDPIVNSLDTVYTLSLELNRLAADQMQVSFSISDAGGVISTYTILDDPNGTGEFGTGPIATDFDQLFFRFSKASETADALDFSRIKIEYFAVPEPTSLALLGLGGLALAFARRRA